MEVIADVAKATFPRAWIVIPTDHGMIALQLEWIGDEPTARWTAGPVLSGLFQRTAQAEPPEPWQAAEGRPVELLTSTAAVHLLLPLAQRWLQQPVRRADALIIWLRTELLLPLEVN
jgi:hypothetical protein